MPRTREFDYDLALDQAMRLFWAKGYSNTSLRELLKVMRIGEGSFYNAVRSKKALYLACLKHYNDVVTRRRLQAFEAEPTVGGRCGASSRACSTSWTIRGHRVCV